MQGDVDAGKYSWRDNVWNSREGTGPYGEPTYNHNAPIKPFKIKSSIPKREYHKRVKIDRIEFPF